MSDDVTAFGLPVPELSLPQYELDHALGCLESALRQLQAAQEVQWQSAAADLFRRELYLVIGEVRHVQDRALAAEDAWMHLRRTAREYGQ